MKFSVSMCVYGKDNPAHFQTAVESILNQTVQPSEVVLVVDGPVPKELDVVIRFFEKNELFHVIRLIKNQGHGNARRIGLAACSNELVALMDADDISASTRFESQINMFLCDSELSIVGGNISEFIDDEKNIVAERRVPFDDADIKKYMKKRCPMNQVSVMFKKQSVEAVGGYVDWYCEEDYYLWLRMALADMKFANVNENLVNVRVGKELYARRGGWKYYKSEAKLQKYMFEHKIIGYPTYVLNKAKRFVVQVLLPNSVRGWVFKKFARSKVNAKEV